MVESTIPVPQGLTTEGLLGRRYMARLIDTMLLLFLLYRPVVAASANLLPRLGPMIAFPAVLFLWVGYGALMESCPWQATLGKRVMGLRVFDAEANGITLFQGAIRNVVKDGPFLVLGLVPEGRSIAFLWLIAHLVVIHRSAVNQAIHDRAANTWVAARERTTQLRLG